MGIPSSKQFEALAMKFPPFLTELRKSVNPAMVKRNHQVTGGESKKYLI